MKEVSRGKHWQGTAPFDKAQWVTLGAQFTKAR